MDDYADCERTQKVTGQYHQDVTMHSKSRGKMSLWSSLQNGEQFHKPTVIARMRSHQDRPAREILWPKVQQALLCGEHTKGQASHDW